MYAVFVEVETEESKAVGLYRAFSFVEDEAVLGCGLHQMTEVLVMLLLVLPEDAYVVGDSDSSGAVLEYAVHTFLEHVLAEI